MGLLDDALGKLGGLAAQGGEGQSSNIVGALLGGAGGQGGMTGVLETLAANGLAEHVASWTGGGQNLPVSPEQLQQALGSEQVQQLAQSTGLPVGDFLKHLADHLPAAAAASNA
jgi:uncharacterized protein YidB (DUF937 family)